MKIKRFNESVRSGELDDMNILYYKGNEYNSVVLWTKENDVQIKDIKFNDIGGYHGELNTNNAFFITKNELLKITDQMNSNSALFIGYCDHLNINNINKNGTRIQNVHTKRFDL